jgi:hypothetical protein
MRLTRSGYTKAIICDCKMPQNQLTVVQTQAVDAALESLTFLKLVARVQGVGIAKLSRRDIEGFVRAADRATPQPVEPSET